MPRGKAVKLSIDVSKLSVEVLERIADGIENEISKKLASALPHRTDGFALFVTVEVKDGALLIEVDVSAGGSYRARRSYEDAVEYVMKGIENVVRHVLMRSEAVREA